MRKEAGNQKHQRFVAAGYFGSKFIKLYSQFMVRLFCTPSPSAPGSNCLLPELSMGWVDPWVGLGWVGLGRDFLVLGGLGWVHHRKSAGNLKGLC